MYKHITPVQQTASYGTLHGVLSPAHNSYGSTLTLTLYTFCYLQDKRSGEGHVQKTYTRFTLLLATLFCMCGDVIVLAACSIPALLCIQKVRHSSTHKLTCTQYYGSSTETPVK